MLLLDKVAMTCGASLTAGFQPKLTFIPTWRVRAKAVAGTKTPNMVLKAPHLNLRDLFIVFPLLLNAVLSK
jgi:hypothetical protein